MDKLIIKGPMLSLPALSTRLNNMEGTLSLNFKRSNTHKLFLVTIFAINDKVWVADFSDYYDLIFEYNFQLNLFQDCR